MLNKIVISTKNEEKSVTKRNGFLPEVSGCLIRAEFLKNKSLDETYFINNDPFSYNLIKSLTHIK
jgi:hypothetical protein